MTETTPLPTHPFTGLRALAVMPSGRPVWPVFGGNGAGGDGGGTGDGGAGDGGDGGAGTGQGEQGGGEQGRDKTFDQAAVDRIVADRLARERSKYGDYDALKSKAAEFDRLKESQATEQEKALNQVRKDTETAIRGQLEPQINRLEVALKLGLPDELGAKVVSAAKRLVGETVEELEADAREFFAATPITVGSAGTGGTSLDQGARGRAGSDKPSVASGADLYAQRRGKKT